MSEQKEACGVLCTWPVHYIQCGECLVWQYSEEKSRAYNKLAGYCCPIWGLTFADEYCVDVRKGIRAFDDVLPEGESTSSD